MFKHRIIFLIIMSTIWAPMFSMQGNLGDIVEAAETGDLGTIQTLDPDGLNPAITVGRNVGLTPLHIAACEGQLPIVVYYVNKLESQGKDINPVITIPGPSLGWMPICVAAQRGHLAIVEYYVNKLESLGMDINPAITAGQLLGITPVYIAADQGHLAVVDCFVKKFESQGRDINPAIMAGQVLGWTPFHIASSHCDLALVIPF